VSSLRVLARTRSLYRAKGTLILQKIVFGKYAQHFLHIVHPAGGWPAPLAHSEVWDTTDLCIDFRLSSHNAPGLVIRASCAGRIPR
jgi:hypothetical protein